MEQKIPRCPGRILKPNVFTYWENFVLSCIHLFIEQEMIFLVNNTYKKNDNFRTTTKLLVWYIFLNKKLYFSLLFFQILSYKNIIERSNNLKTNRSISPLSSHNLPIFILDFITKTTGHSFELNWRTSDLKVLHVKTHTFQRFFFSILKNSFLTHSSIKNINFKENSPV